MCAEQRAVNSSETAQEWVSRGLKGMNKVCELES